MKLSKTKWWEGVKIICEAVRSRGYDFIYFNKHEWEDPEGWYLDNNEKTFFFDKDHDWEIYEEPKKEVITRYYKWLIKSGTISESANFYGDDKKFFMFPEMKRESSFNYQDECFIKKIPSKWIDLNENGEIVVTSWDEGEE